VISLSVYTSEPLSSIALEFLLRSCEDIALLPVVSDLPSLLRQVSSEEPNVLLLAVNADLDWELLTKLRRESVDTKIVIWLHEITAEVAYQARHRGVSGILRKNLPPEMILKCVRKVHEGELWFEKTLTEAFLTGSSIKVSRRECELITLVAQGLKNREIAEAMYITEGTVKVYLSRLFEKVGARDRIELALIGLRNLQVKLDPGAPVPAVPNPGHSLKDTAGPARRKPQPQSTRLFFARPAAR
jgi:DNA-binding NarL/FixJ family response regulator